jgi:hypothetical protein
MPAFESLEDLTIVGEGYVVRDLGRVIDVQKTG